MVVEGGIFSCICFPAYRESEENNIHQIIAFLDYFLPVYFQTILNFSHLRLFLSLKKLSSLQLMISLSRIICYLLLLSGTVSSSPH